MPHRHLARSTALAGLLLVSPALADELVLPSRIVEVTVFPDRAEIARDVDASLTPGSHSLRIAGLPAGLLADSVRVEARAEGGLMIGAVETRPQFSAELASPAENIAFLSELWSARDKAMQQLFQTIAESLQ